MDQPQRKVWPPITAVSRMDQYQAAFGDRPHEERRSIEQRLADRLNNVPPGVRVDPNTSQYQAQALDQLRQSQIRAQAGTEASGLTSRRVRQ